MVLFTVWLKGSDILIDDFIPFSSACRLPPAAWLPPATTHRKKRYGLMVPRSAWVLRVF